MAGLASTPTPPYYAVIFSSIRKENDNGYEITAQQMLELASKQPGFLGFETARQEIGLSVSYWQSLEAIQKWKQNSEHQQAQAHAGDWYSAFRV